MKTAILFDLDGTVMDTLADLHAGVNHTLEAFGMPGRSLEQIRRFVGDGARKLILRSMPGTPEDPDLDTVFSHYQAYYTQHCLDRTCPFDGVYDVFKSLGKDCKLGIVSNKPHAMTKRICDKFFPGMYVLGQQPQLPAKPAPDMLLKAMEDLEVQRCVFVGDGETDVLTAKNAGVPCLSVLWGFRDKEVLAQAGAVHFCENVRDIPKAVRQLLEA